ncbi:MAG TPA: bifunctional diaminohydroxyphosphoribosylaminopyrimidine deaminase/5-amino-6-(5-phosphoribosylamino)uracil reductase RibD [Xanthobacteraceae bacterium]|jgi:diaminohydroxyphosphoribosylaminopyrimidine deaminase/5-amino-6-(5-phosphoribosylamino)uracil reductase|nr:bifunctional diaminohydroxyphosphoribosylaminopyrimidine deaminase/5-amino-6-(5-phosphoribosylamino)uracil reductase RibD [Xanthobacteraceae bacterium]
MSKIDPVQDARFMDLAFALGRRGLGNTWPNPAVGAVVVRADDHGPVIVGRGWTQPGGRPHAEVEALRHAGELARGATLYATLEPCAHHGKTPPCADAIIASGIGRVVSAMDDPNPRVAGAGNARLRAHGIAITSGLGAEKAQRAHAGHIRRMRDGRPHVTLKLAVSADEKAGLAGRKPAVITSERARERAHLLRANNDAIAVGIGTVLADDPQLTCRLPGMADRSPVRIVFDGALRLPLGSQLVRTASTVPVWVIALPSASAAAEDALRKQNVDVLRVEANSQGQIDIAAALRVLAERGITRLLVEGGPILSASFIVSDLVDAAELFRAPSMIGAEGISALESMPLTALTKSVRLRSLGIETIGPDCLESFERVQ